MRLPAGSPRWARRVQLPRCD